MSDLISRQAAIDATCKACSMEEDYHKCDGYPETSTWCDGLVALRALPSAERKKGKWELMFNGQFKGGAYWFSCSKCNRIVPEVRNGGWNYCPNCGAKMER